MKGKKPNVTMCKLLERNGIRYPRKFLVQKNTTTLLQLMEVKTRDIYVYERDGDDLQLRRREHTTPGGRKKVFNYE